uniref:Uncharacterized protein n=1 Tax=Salix viminalis TaxID=40686 RepID=A0A6N2LM41_SALVM
MCCGLEIQYSTPIQECGECFLPMVLRAHAAFSGVTTKSLRSVQQQISSSRE